MWPWTGQRPIPGARPTTEVIISGSAVGGGEHRYGSFEYQCTCFFWKINCYDLQMERHSLDVTDPAVTVRVLSQMHADEY